jgi:16S rRNA G1207 methylase RsmC
MPLLTRSSLQVHSWPQNPVDLIASQIRKNPKWIVADMGCGDAKLAATLSNKVHSFDLVAKNDRVTACDIAHVPLENDTVTASLIPYHPYLASRQFKCASIYHAKACGVGYSF